MRLTVDHVTRYRYDRPVRSVVQSLRLTPSVCDAQTVLDWQITVGDGVAGGAFRDGAGDRVTAFTIAGPASEIAVTVRGTVETFDTAGVLRGLREVVVPEAWLVETPPTAADPGLRALAEGAYGADALSLSHDLARAVADAIAYRPGVTHAHTTAAEALALGEGVCQDHAHAMIACARLRGLPARYVQGYLFATEDGTPHESAHAWAEVHVAGLGWVGFDPANRCCPDERYIRLGSGRDARDAAPIRGIARGVAPQSSAEAMEVTVSVQSAGQSAGQ
jgi:transglutaminase-like putative cysteine protease